ncbi:unnamed protein product [Vitrella brassicaformis CCMP3155]|uniref:Uncharacterized protein n=1 Tax=Vitrella brassicaformis (strain CCMP3155) TaxID=1169540 RepID=A0A0G4EZK9_VITBC|nr:unnamed protein product [Vitrella brassicaformis CCMP3155]|eukprot:CEM04247.1 unnamed protein product [Vitrella brassicaformis CCMP3155]
MDVRPFTLRIGLSLQLLAFLLFNTIVWPLRGHKFIQGLSAFVQKSYSSSDFTDAVEEAVERAVDLRAPVLVILLVMLGGAIFLAAFQAYLHTGEKANKGMAAGGKLLGYAVTLDLLATTGALVFWGTIVKFAGGEADKELMQLFLSSGEVYTAYFTAFVIRSVSVIIYGVSFFLLEWNCPDTTGMPLAWTIATCYKLAGVCGLINAMLPLLSASFGLYMAMLALYGLGLLVATLWSYLYEPSLIIPKFKGDDMLVENTTTSTMMMTPMPIVG